MKKSDFLLKSKFLTRIGSDLLPEPEFLIPYRMQDTQLKLSQARFNLTAATVGNLVIFAGDKNICDTIDVFAYENGQLSKQDTQLKLSEARFNFAAATVGNLVVFAGGLGHDNSDKIDVFAYENGQLSKQDTQLKLSKKRASLAAATVGNLVVFAGGCDSSGSRD
ncbi:MAG: hypothetical protein AAF063_29650 [Cyanobacteria bacterium J06643_5]